MQIQFMEVEPYNNTGLDPESIRSFFTRIPRNGDFEFDGNTRPKCMLMDVIIYKENMGLNNAKGVLLSIDLDTYFDKLDAGKSHQELLRIYGIGGIEISYRTEDYPIRLQVTAKAKTF
jgi:hypothetical protein